MCWCYCCFFFLSFPLLSATFWCSFFYSTKKHEKTNHRMCFCGRNPYCITNITLHEYNSWDLFCFFFFFEIVFKKIFCCCDSLWMIYFYTNTIPNLSMTSVFLLAVIALFVIFFIYQNIAASLLSHITFNLKERTFVVYLFKLLFWAFLKTSLHVFEWINNNDNQLSINANVSFQRKGLFN